MKKLAVTSVLLASLVAGSVAPVLAAHYTQVYPTAQGWVTQPVRQPVFGAAQLPQPQPAVQLAAVPASNDLSPQVILNRLITSNNVPKEINPTLVIQDSQTLNAATDGQKLILTTGLLSKLTTADERAFVISHELSHILLQHIGKTQARRIGLSLLDSLFIRRYTQEGSLVQLASELGIGLVDKHSARGFEYQADDLGVKLMSQAGYNPQAALQVFKILQAATPSNRVPEFLQDHPISESRIRTLAQKYKL